MLTAISERPRFSIEPPSSMDLRPLGVRWAPDRAGRVPLLVWLALHAAVLPVAHVPDIWVVGAVDLVAPAVRGVAVEPVRNRCGPIAYIS